MVSAENRTGLYITIPIYFCLLAGATVWAYKRMERMERQGTADKLSAHYIGGRDFGPLIIAGTLFASLFSGYTVVGIPNEAFRTGWSALRWLPTMWAVVWGLMGTGFRLRKISSYRNHQSPADFITDRFQSQILRYTVVFLQILTSIIYLAAQVIAIKGSFNSIFGLDPETVYPVIVVMILILVFECIGGLNSVAFTDGIQGIIMVFAFVTIPCLLAKNFGGWSTLDPLTYPQPSFYQTPSADSQWKFWQFGLINFSFFCLPHFLQRIYAVRDLKALKIGYSVVTIAPWLTSFVGIFIGTIGVAILVNDDGTPQSPDDPFTAILETLMDVGGFSRFCACIGITASLAAIMSTADSLIIAISQLVTVEIFYPMMPHTTPKKMAWFGRIASVLAVALALVIGLCWKEGITDLGKIQFPLTAQLVPPFLLGLFAKNRFMDVHPWCLAAAVWSSSIYVTVIYFGYLKPASDPLAIDSGITGIVIQVVLVVILESSYRLLFLSNDNKRDDKMHTKDLLCPGRPQWDIPKRSRFGVNSLTPQLIWKSMKGFYEPMTNPSWVVLMFCLISLTTPLVAPNEPPLAEDGVFLYEPAIVDGLPWWAFKIILLCLLPQFVLLWAIYKIPNDFPKEDDSVISKKGVDVDLVTLTRKEMGRRSSYDEQNILIHRRRHTIVSAMEEMGISVSTEKTAAELSLEVSQSGKRLSNLVYGLPSLEKLVEGETVKNNDIDDGAVPTDEREIDL